MAFRLPPNLTIGGQYRVVSPGDVAALEGYLPPGSRVLVGLVFERRYDGFEADCERCNLELAKQAGLYPWPEYRRFVTADPDGQPIAWVSYLSSPAWWAIILGVVGAIFLLPILTVTGFWITEKILPGIGPLITLGILAALGYMVFTVGKEVAKAVIEERVAK